MAKFIAFLRAINVGGHVVKMEHLRGIFASLGFSNVETFIASGNVLFEASSKSAVALENQIEMKLRDDLGYEVSTFIRTDLELKEIARYQPFPHAEVEAATAFNIAFLKKPLDAKEEQKVVALRTAVDNFHVHGRELYWLCLKKQSDSSFSNAVLEKTLGKRSTLRGAATVQKIAEAG